MTKIDLAEIEALILEAVTEAIEAIGLEAFKAASFFGSNTELRSKRPHAIRT